jgi:hypothetical protein
MAKMDKKEWGSGKDDNWHLAIKEYKNMQMNTGNGLFKTHQK